MTGFILWLVWTALMALITGMSSEKKVDAEEHYIMWVLFPVWFVYGLLLDVRIMFHMKLLKTFLKVYMDMLFPYP